MADKRLRVRIFGVPIACVTGATDAWRRVADQVSAQLEARFGEQVKVDYYDLFSPGVDRFPDVLARVAEGAQVPIVYVDSVLVSSGGKISIPALARYIEERIQGTGPPA